MIDWQGLLKFSLKYTDNTKVSEFKEMPEQDKKWLEKVMEEYSSSEVKRIINILEQIKDYKQMKQQFLLNELEQLQDLLDSLDQASTLYKMQGHITLLKIIFYSSFENCRIVALQIYTSANQNDARIQNQSINTGALELIELLKKQQSMKMKENLLSAVSATVRGQNLEAKRILIRLDGLELLEKLFQNSSAKLKHKIYVLLRDLLFYDDRLHLTHNDLSQFNNTAGIKVNGQKEYDLKYDPNQQFKEKNQLPENEKYKGCVHKFVEQKKQLFMNYLVWLKERVKQENQQN